MKTLNLRKYNMFPYATAAKNAMQQWNFLLKLPADKKRFFKNKTRMFSMEYGRSLPKRIFWQISIPEKKGLQNPSSFPKLQTFQQNWSAFRSVFYGKLWMLNNPSLVPGVVWPVKSKKIIVAKIRAFKALSSLTGKGNLKFVLQNMQKLWNTSLCTKPSLWALACGVDSLQGNFLLKSGIIPTRQNGLHCFSYGKISVNGHTFKKNLSFSYPGDFIQINLNTASKNVSVIANLLNAGPRKESLGVSNKYGNSIYSGKAFSWLAPFYNNKQNTLFLVASNFANFSSVKQNPTYFKSKKIHKNSNFKKTFKKSSFVWYF